MSYSHKAETTGDAWIVKKINKNTLIKGETELTELKIKKDLKQLCPIKI